MKTLCILAVAAVSFLLFTQVGAAQTIHRIGTWQDSTEWGYQGYGRRAVFSLDGQNTAVVLFDSLSVARTDLSRSGEQTILQTPIPGAPICNVQYRGSRLYSFLLQDSFVHAFYVDAHESTWHRAPWKIPVMHLDPAQIAVPECLLLPELPYLVVRVQAYWAWRTDPIEMQYEIFSVDVSTNEVRRESWPNFESYSWSPDLQMLLLEGYAHDSYNGARIVCTEGYAQVDLRTRSVIEQHEYAPRGLRRGNASCLGVPLVCARGQGLLRCNSGVFTEREDVPLILTCVGAPSAIVGREERTGALVYYDFATGTRVVFDTLPPFPGETTAMFEPSTKTVLIRVLTRSEPVTRIYLRYACVNIDGNESLVTYKSADAVPLYDSITVTVFPLVREQAKRQFAVVRDTVIDCESGEFVLHGTVCEDSTYTVALVYSDHQRIWSDPQQRYAVYLPHGLVGTVRNSASMVTDLQISPNCSMVSIGQLYSVAIRALSNVPTDAPGGLIWSRATNGAACFGSYGGAPAVFVTGSRADSVIAGMPQLLTVTALALPSLREQEIIWTEDHLNRFPDNLQGVHSFAVPTYDTSTGILSVLERMRYNNGIHGLNSHRAFSSCYHSWNCRAGTVRPGDLTKDQSKLLHLTGCSQLDHWSASRMLFVSDDSVGMADAQTGVLTSIVKSQQTRVELDKVVSAIAVSQYCVITNRGFHHWDGKWYHSPPFPFSDGVFVLRVGEDHTCILRDNADTMGCIVDNATGMIIEWLGQGFRHPTCGVYNAALGVLYVGTLNGSVSTVKPHTVLQRRVSMQPDPTCPTSNAIGSDLIPWNSTAAMRIVHRSEGVNIVAPFDLASIHYLDASGALIAEVVAAARGGDVTRLDVHDLQAGLVAVMMHGTHGELQRCVLLLD